MATDEASDMGESAQDTNIANAGVGAVGVKARVEQLVASAPSQNDMIHKSDLVFVLQGMVDALFGD